VTQCISANTLTRGSSWTSSQLKVSGDSTRPPISNCHSSKSMSGGPNASSTGHFRVRAWRGGRRFPPGVSGLMTTSRPRPSGAGISSGCMSLRSAMTYSADWPEDDSYPPLGRKLSQESVTFRPTPAHDRPDPVQVTPCEIPASRQPSLRCLRIRRTLSREGAAVPRRSRHS